MYEPSAHREENNNTGGFFGANTCSYSSVHGGTSSLLETFLIFVLDQPGCPKFCPCPRTSLGSGKHAES